MYAGVYKLIFKELYLLNIYSFIKKITVIYTLSK